MTDEVLRGRWADETGSPPADREGCPTPVALLDLAEDRNRVQGGEGPLDPDRQELLLHLATCSACRADLAVASALLRAAAETGGGAAVPPGGEASAGGASVPADSRARRSPRFSLARAASILLAVGLGGSALVRWAWMGEGEGSLRGQGGEFAAAVVTCSEPGVVLLRWEEVAGAERYRVEIFNDAGEPVARAEGPDPSVRIVLPPEEMSRDVVLLQAVEAMMPGGTVLTTPAARLPAACLPSP
jgi:hypothetical protein